MMSDPQWPAPREEGKIVPLASQPLESGGTSPLSPTDDSIERPLSALIGITRTAVGLIIGAAASGLEALLAEVTAKRGTPSQRH